MKLLLANQAGVDEVDIYGFPPLMYAGSVGHSEIVTTLIAAKANLFHVNDHGTTALDFASNDKIKKISFNLENE